MCRYKLFQIRPKIHVCNNGIPQGSILGQLIFLVNINDFVVDTDFSIQMFADDISTFQLL